MTMRTSSVGIVIAMIVLWAAGPTGAQLQQPEAPYVQSVDMAVAVEKMAPDTRGTDVDNIYTFTLDYTDGIDRRSTYNLIFYLDGVYGAEYKGIQLPYQFSRDFKGQLDGSHEIRLDLEDATLMIVGRKTVVVNVNHN